MLTTPQVTWNPWNAVQGKKARAARARHCAAVFDRIPRGLFGEKRSLAKARGSEAVVDELEVFDELHAHKCRAAEHRDQQPELQPAIAQELSRYRTQKVFLAVLDGGVRLDHRN